MRETWVIGAASNRYGRMADSGREAAARVALEEEQADSIVQDGTSGRPRPV